MDSYSILGIEKESSMEDIEKAYIDKISKIKKEVKNEKNAAKSNNSCKNMLGLTEKVLTLQRIWDNMQFFAVSRFQVHTYNNF